MPPTVGLLVIHGMGDQSENYADGLFAGLRRHLGQDTGRVAVESCYWADVLQHHQDQIWQRVMRSGNVSWTSVRKWMMSSFGDPPAYLSGYFKSGQQAYQLVHERVRASLNRLERRLDPRTDKRLMILAHSLGSVIATNYIWDQQKRPTPGASPFERTEPLTTLVTYGSNIPLFLPPVRPVECIQFPWPTLSQPWRDHAHWLNVYAPADLLGFPIGGLWDLDHGTVISDVALPVGPWPLNHTPLSHTKYDTDEAFLDIVAQEVRLVASLRNEDPTEVPTRGGRGSFTQAASSTVRVEP